MTEAQHADPGSREYLTFSGNTHDYFRIWIVNIVLTFLTLGAYSAWAKVRRNRYFYGHTRLREGRFDYHADPLAILRGRIIAVALLLLVLATQAYLPALMPFVGTLLVVVIPWLIVRSRMFSMRNTSYSNVRFGFVPAYWGAFRTVFFVGLLTFGTVGIGTPVAHYLRNRFVVRHTRFGNLPLRMEAPVWDFFLAYLLTFVASAIIIAPLLEAAFGLLGGLRIPAGEYTQYAQWALSAISALAVWYIAGQFLIAATLKATLQGSFIGSDDDAVVVFRLGCDWSLNRLLFMYVVNFVAVLLSLGMLVPWAQMRVARYLVSGTWVEVHGSLEDVVSLQGEKVSSIGEEVGSAFDVDIGL